MIIKTKDFQYECASAEQHNDGIHLLKENGELKFILNAKVVEVIDGEIIMYDDQEPTQLDMIEAQVAYTAMMTDTLLEV